MREEKGITMVSLAIYIIVMIIVIVIMTMTVNSFYQNTEAVQGNVEEIVEFNKFNNYFLKEVKIKDNKVDTVNTSYILFSSGNTFSISNNSIYYNNIKICNKVKSMQIKLGINGDGVDETIINVTLKFNNFSKTINYKLENIY